MKIVKRIQSKLRILAIAILFWFGVTAPYSIAWIFLGLAFISAIIYLQDTTNFLTVNGKFLGAFKPLKESVLSPTLRLRAFAFLR